MDRPDYIRWPALVVASLVMPLFLSACGTRHGYTGSHDNILRTPMLAEPTTFDPAMVQDGTTIDVLQQIYEGLVQWTPQNTLAPALAKSWTVSPDGKNYTFHLRPNVHFHSGATVTAQDVVFSITRSLDPKLASPVGMTYLGDILGAPDFADGKAKTLAGIKAVGSQTVQITISKPKAYWLNVLTYPTAYVVNPASVAKDPQGNITEKNTDGTGPFQLTSYAHGSSVTLTAFQNYWDGAPHIAGQYRPILTDANARHDLFMSGKLDIVDETEGSLQADEADPQIKPMVKLFPRAATYYIGLGESAFPLFKNKLVRQAFAYATDKKKISSEVFGGQRDVAEDILPEGVPGYDTNFRGIPYDPAKARQLLAQAGYPNGKGFPPVPMSYRESYPDLQKTVDLLRIMYMQNLGVTVEPRQTEWATLLTEEDNSTLPMYHIRWSADYLDPQDYYTILLRTGSPEDHIGYSNPVYDALCDKADVDQNPAERMALYRKAAAMAADEVPLIPLYYQKDVELVNPRLRGLDDGLMGHLPYKHVSFVPAGQ